MMNPDNSVSVSYGIRKREYNNVSLSDALKQLAEQQTDYTIMFLYNELEDFRITTTIKNKRLPEAIQQMIGFYPIRVTTSTEEDGRKIFVECTHKNRRTKPARCVCQRRHSQSSRLHAT